MNNFMDHACLEHRFIDLEGMGSLTLAGDQDFCRCSESEVVVHFIYVCHLSASL